MLKKWDLKDKETVFESFPFNVLKKSYIKPDDHSKFTAFVLESPNWANVIAQDSDMNILLIRQYRFGTDKIELEIPGGCIEVNEDPLIGIQRELKEETGYTSKKWTQIGVVDVNPAIQNNKCYTFLAENIIKTEKQNLDEFEDIEYEFATPKETRAYIRLGKIKNTYIIAAFHWLALYRELK